LNKKFVIKSLVILSLSSGTCLTLYGVFVVPEIEKVSQGSMVQFLKDLQGEDVYVTPVGMKSYAQFYYAEKQPDEIGSGIYNKKQALLEEKGVMSFNELNTQEKTDFNTAVIGWLLKDVELDKEAYFYVRAYKNNMTNYPKCQFLYREAGYEFYKRVPESN